MASMHSQWGGFPALSVYSDRKKTVVHPNVTAELLVVRISIAVWRGMPRSLMIARWWTDSDNGR